MAKSPTVVEDVVVEDVVVEDVVVEDVVVEDVAPDEEIEEELTDEEIMLAKFAAAKGKGEGKKRGLSWKILATVFIKRNYYGLPVKDCAAIIGKVDARVTEIASGRDYRRYSAKEDKTQLHMFINAIQNEYAAIGLVYTGDYQGNNSHKKLQ